MRAKARRAQLAAHLRKRGREASSNRRPSFQKAGPREVTGRSSALSRVGLSAEMSLGRKDFSGRKPARGARQAGFGVVGTSLVPDLSEFSRGLPRRGTQE